MKICQPKFPKNLILQWSEGRKKSEKQRNQLKCKIGLKSEGRRTEKGNTYGLMLFDLRWWEWSNNTTIIGFRSTTSPQMVDGSVELSTMALFNEIEITLNAYNFKHPFRHTHLSLSQIFPIFFATQKYENYCYYNISN